MKVVFFVTFLKQQILGISQDHFLKNF